MSLSLTFDNISKKYPTTHSDRDLLTHVFRRHTGQTKFVLNGFSFSIKKSQCILVTGENGSGKTTLLKLAAGFLKPNQGRIQWDGHLTAPRKELGLYLGHQMLYSQLSGYKNLSYTISQYPQNIEYSQIEQICQIWGIGHWIDSLVETYSNGQRTLLALARATLHQPRLLILDEPDTYLDKHNLDRLRVFLNNTAATKLISTQNVALYHQIADRIIEL